MSTLYISMDYQETMGKDTRTLGQILREARTGARMGLRELARALDKAPSYVSDFEHDRRTPSEGVLLELARLLGLDFDRLMSLAGRLGESTDAYIREHRPAGVLLRKISTAHLSDEEIERLIEKADQIQAGRKTRTKRK